MKAPRLKNAIGLISDRLRLFELGTALRERRHGSSYLRAVNYHVTPSRFETDLEAQLRFYRDHFVPAGRTELEAILAGRWSHDKPGLILSFDDGSLTNFEVAAPLLERYGFVGWFFIPAGLLSGEARARPPREPKMNPDQVRDLAGRHVVGCHSYSHRRLHTTLSDAVLSREILDSKRLMEETLERPVDTFCWVGGDEPSYSARAASQIRRAGYRYAFMTNLAPILPTTDPHQLQRTNIEASWPLPRVRLYLSGVMDLIYAPKRRRVNALTRAKSSARV